MDAPGHATINPTDGVTSDGNYFAPDVAPATLETRPGLGTGALCHPRRRAQRQASATNGQSPCLAPVPPSPSGRASAERWPDHKLGHDSNFNL